MEIKQQEIGVTEGRAFREDGVCARTSARRWEEGVSRGLKFGSVKRGAAVRREPPQGFRPRGHEPRGLSENPRERCGGRELHSASSLCQYVTLPVRKEDEEREDEGQE